MEHIITSPMSVCFSQPRSDEPHGLRWPQFSGTADVKTQCADVKTVQTNAKLEFRDVYHANTWNTIVLTHLSLFSIHP
jgi:hypothetical protein